MGFTKVVSSIYLWLVNLTPPGPSVLSQNSRPYDLACRNQLVSFNRGICLEGDRLTVTSHNFGFCPSGLKFGDLAGVF